MNLLLIVPFLALALVVPPRGSIAIGWSEEEPAAQFHLYYSTSITAPLRDWVCLTNIPGNVYECVVSVSGSRHCFYMTASDEYGLESEPSGVVSFMPGKPAVENLAITIGK